MKHISFFIYFVFFFQTLLQSQTLDATLLELKFSNDGYPEKFTKVDNGFFFSSEDDQLWFSDGSVENTYLVKDFESGLYDDITSITAVGNSVFFVAQIGRDNRELWVSDGTEEGTIQLTDRNVGFSTEGINQIIEYHGKIYFGAYSETYGNELWVSDGTSDGTVVLKDITESGNSNPRGFFIFNDKLIFQASVDGSAYGYWTTDGTETGTVLLKYIQEDNSFGGLTEGQVIYNGDFYFFADNGETGYELWKSNGTTEGTQLVKDIYPGKYNNSSYGMIGVVLNNKLLFIANDGVDGNELWSTDGTSEGTAIFKDFYPGPGNGFQFDAKLQVVGDKVFFTATDGAEQSGLWVSDGTDLGTIFINASWPQIIEGNEIGTVAYYFAYNSEKGKSLFWKSDGTPEGTSVLSEDIEVTNISVSEQDFLAYDNRMFFNGKNKLNGNELWVTDGTPEGTKLFYDVNHSYGVNPSLLTAVGDKLFFRGNKYGTFGLCTSDGTIKGTRYLNIGSNEGGIYKRSKFIDFNGKLIVNANDGVNGYELWISDGTDNGTYMIKDIFEGKNSSMGDYQEFTIIKDKIYFSADDGIHGFEPWVSDGTEEGTYMIKDLFEGPNDGYGSHFGYVDDYIFFNGLKNGSQRGFWKSDGTSQGTIEIDFLSEAGITGVINNKMLLSLNGTLVASDGTQAGTVNLANIGGGIRTSVAGENDFYFVGGNSEDILFKTDGITATQIFQAEHNNDIKQLMICGDYLYFGIREGFSAIDELWRTDGTISGTLQVAGSETEDFSYFRNFTCFKEYLLYIAEISSKNIWATNGVPNQAIQLGIQVSNGPNLQGYDNIGYMAANGDKLYFEARNDISGSEMYVTTPNFSSLSFNNYDALQANTSKKLINIYPNPTTEFINLKSIHNNQIQSFELFDIYGKSLIREENNPLSSEMTYNLSKFSKGIYIIKVHFLDGNNESSKIIISD
ncbi:T9SS type A sorting domain-containing protein [Hyunsoonleella ulvae]|uniref:T9SS type A sorting domain-containing protein n=1 Tax=Hyunsoonleella ulvae TaxID=2799948 RepID=UPI00193A3A9B|nr:T9SS type A sorting domain-containing protein [Hyunsoonleella ulvae]